MSFFSKIFSRNKKPASGESGQKSSGNSAAAKRAETLEYLKRFTETRKGCEMYIEPSTNVTQSTVVLVATSGEWTRRKVPDAKAAWALAKELEVACYDVQLVGYPQRMRRWNEEQRRKMRDK